MTCKTPEEFKAWSQNLGHEKVLTIFINYGAVAAHRQAALMRGTAATETEYAVPVRLRLGWRVWRPC